VSVICIDISVRDLALVLASPTKMCVLFGLRFRKEVLNQRALYIICT